MSKTDPSASQREVWEWKEQAHQEVAHLDLPSAIEKRLKDSMKTAEQLERAQASR